MTTKKTPLHVIKNNKRESLSNHQGSTINQLYLPFNPRHLTTDSTLTWILFSSVTSVTLSVTTKKPPLHATKNNKHQSSSYHQASTINQFHSPLNPQQTTTQNSHFSSLLRPSSSNTIDTLSREIRRSIPFDVSETPADINDRYTRVFSLLVTVDTPSKSWHRRPEARSNRRIQWNRETKRVRERKIEASSRGRRGWEFPAT